MRGSVANYLNNTVEFAKKLGPTLAEGAKKVNLDEYANKFKNISERAANVTDTIHETLKRNVGFSRYGNPVYGSYQRPGEGFNIPRPDKTVRSAVKDPVGFATDFFGSNVFSEKNRQKAWLYTNPFRLVSKAGVAASKFTGIEDPVAQQAIAVGVPILFHSLTETSGPLHQGLRPKGYKAVAPVSKEKDPTGATPRSVGEEFALRFYGGQKSQPLAYKDFIKERPDIMPSTITDYRRYMNRKPEAGKSIDIDPEKQTFTAFGGLVRGTARGLNDPEIRVKGVPLSASAVLGGAAGIGTIAAGKRFLDPKGLGVSGETEVRASSVNPEMVNIKTGEVTPRQEYKVGTIPTIDTPKTQADKGEMRFYKTPPGPGDDPKSNRIPLTKLQDRLREQREYRSRADANVARAEKEFAFNRTHPDAAERRKAKVDLDEAREIRTSAQQDIEETVRATKEFAKKNLNVAGQKFQEVFARNPGLKEPALVVGGLAAAVGTAAIAKKLFQKAEQERIKKEDPLQYKKYKRGDYTKE